MTKLLIAAAAQYDFIRRSAVTLPDAENTAEEKEIA